MNYFVVETYCVMCKRSMLVRRVSGGIQLDVSLCDRCREEDDELKAEAERMEKRARGHLL